MKILDKAGESVINILDKAGETVMKYLYKVLSITNNKNIAILILFNSYAQTN